VKAEDIPKEKAAPKKPVRKPVARKPAANQADLLPVALARTKKRLPGHPGEPFFVFASDMEICQRE